YYAYFTCEYTVPDTDAQYLRTVDLGILRSLSTVLFDCEGTLVKNSFKVFNDNKKRAKLNVMDIRIKGLQQSMNWKLLKKLRAYRRNFVEDGMRKSSKLFAECCAGCKVLIGYPKHIKYRHFKGNGNKKHRARLGSWSYRKHITYIQHACEAFGVHAQEVNERMTSKRCSNCGSLNTDRPYKSQFSLFHCNDCFKTYNADFNACVNLGIKPIAPQRSAIGGCGLNQQAIKMTAPLHVDDPAQKRVSA
ncbi:MAG: zinc ribbon domain-containing protein, partial [Candidatus Woesearchaeota archaeon]